MKIVHIVGNRPQFIKLAPFLKATNKYSQIKNIIVHSGQHYDFEMSGIFFKELGIPKVKYNLGVGSGTHGVQTGNILIELDRVLLKEKPSVVIIYGDTNTTLAGALAAYKLHFPLAHVEAGLRECIWRPEEINKKITDHCADFCFCPLKSACLNLKKEGIAANKIFFTGDITYDAFLANKKTAANKAKIKIPEKIYILMTMHRAETVDVYKKVKDVVDAIVKLPIKVIYPIHPRTQKQLIKFGLYEKLKKADNIKLIKPIGYFEFLKLLLDSELVITDSGGVIKEAFYANKPSITLDSTSEYKKEIFDRGYNILAGIRKENILRQSKVMLRRKLPLINISKNPFGRGQAADKMVSILLKKIKD